MQREIFYKHFTGFLQYLTTDKQDCKVLVWTEVKVERESMNIFSAITPIISQPIKDVKS